MNLRWNGRRCLSEDWTGLDRLELDHYTKAKAHSTWNQAWKIISLFDLLGLNERLSNIQVHTEAVTMMMMKAQNKDPTKYSSYKVTNSLKNRLLDMQYALYKSAQAYAAKAYCTLDLNAAFVSFVR